MTKTPEQLVQSTATLIACAIGSIILVGCASLDQPDVPELEPPVVVTPDAPPVVEPTQQHSEQGDQRLLVKPKADNTGKLVILLPAAWNNDFRDVWLIDRNGTRHNDTGRRNINKGKSSNGNRRHVWFKKSGASFGNGTLVVVLTTGTKRLQYNFATRTEKKP